MPISKYLPTFAAQKRNQMRKLILLFLSVAILPSCSAKCGSSSSSDMYPNADSGIVDDNATDSLTILFAGDMMQHDNQIRTAAVAGGFDYSDCFAFVKDQVEAADIAIANLEVTLGGKPYAGFPRFSAPDEYAKAIQDAGFDVLTTTNNHCCDTGSRGLGRTLQVLDSLGIPSLGTYRNADDRAGRYPLMVEKNGFRLALLAYTYATNGLPVPQPYVVNLIDTVQIKQDIERAKAMNPDVIIAFMHWGIEYSLTPSNTQRWQAEWLLSHGVDHVIGSHPHVVQPIELRDSSHLVVWSLGNFISNMTKGTTYGGLMVTLKLTKKQQKTAVNDASYSLIWTSRPAVSGHRTHRVYPIDVPDSLLNIKERSMRDVFSRTARNLFNKYNKVVKEQ